MVLQQGVIARAGDLCPPAMYQTVVFHWTTQNSKRYYILEILALPSKKLPINVSANASATCVEK